MLITSFKDIKTTYDMCLCLEEVSSFVNAQQGEQQQPSPRKNRKPKAPKGNFSDSMYRVMKKELILLKSILFEAKYFLDF